MPLRYYAGGDKELVAEPPPLETPRTDVYDAAFERWWAQSGLTLEPSIKRYCELAFLAGRASVQPAPTPAVSSFRPVDVDHVKTLAIMRDVNQYGDDPFAIASVLDHKTSKTLVAALAYFADMVLQSGAGGEELLTYQEAQDLLKQLTKAE